MYVGGSCWKLRASSIQDVIFKTPPWKAPQELLRAAKDLIFKCLLTQVAAVKIQNQGTATVHINELLEQKGFSSPPSIIYQMLYGNYENATVVRSDLLKSLC